uniref:SMP-LTD domain-containing protein n=1 Tax=Knipowitschia caucasica TaxID=637954 RepID=A0AAV2JZ44_KNICA
MQLLLVMMQLLLVLLQLLLVMMQLLLVMMQLLLVMMQLLLVTVEVLRSFEVVEVLRSFEVVEVLRSFEVVEVLRSFEVVEVQRSFEVVEVLRSFEVVEVLRSFEVVEVLSTDFGAQDMSTTSKMDASLSGPTLNSSPISYPSHGPPLPEEPDPLASLTDVSQLWLKFGKTFLMMLPIYVLGYFEFSFSWVLVGLAALFYWKRNHSKQDNRINRALRFLEHKESVTQRSAATTQLPPWVHYPDVERVEWLNKTVKQMWPFICQFVDKLFRETIEPSVKTASPYLSSFCFTKIDLGDKPLRVNGVKVYTENVDKRQVIMDLEVSFVGNTEIDIDIKKFYCRAGIKNIQLHGVMRVVMEPLLGDMPLIGALSVFFLKKPWLDINWTGLTNMLDIPGVK